MTLGHMTLTQLSSLWGQKKFEIESFLGLSPDAVHVHVGVLLYLLFSLVTWRPFGSVIPWLLTLAVELSNEYLDLHQTGGNPEANMAASIHDVLNTMFIPTMLTLYGMVARWIGRMEGR